MDARARPISLRIRTVALTVGMLGATLCCARADAPARTHPHAATPRGAEMALAVPRLPAPSRVVALPRPLDADEAARVRQVFALRARGRLTAAAAAMRGLDDSPLFGHLLADAYLAPGARVSADDLVAWIAHYADLPQLPAIYGLLQAKLPQGAPPLPLPPTEALGREAEAVPPVEPPEAPDTGLAGLKRWPDLEVEVYRRAEAGQIDAALDRIARAHGIEPVYAFVLQAEVARRLFLRGDDAAALALAADVLAASGDRVGVAALVGGFAAWRMGQLDRAEALFEAAWLAPRTRLEDRVAGAFWAARTRQRQGAAPGRDFWLGLAAAHPMTFYGMIARRTLGMDDGFLAAQPPPPERRGPRETVGLADIDAVDATMQGHRAFALLQVGQLARAEQELRLLWSAPGVGDDLRHSLMRVAREAGLGTLATQIAARLRAPVGDWCGFPVPVLAPLHGYVIEPALVYGVTRQESDFDTMSLSSAGARGLMQLMPATAGEVAGEPTLADVAVERLHEPGLNLDLGQRFLEQLAATPIVDGDMMRLLAAYYSGARAVSRWAAPPREGADPFLFLESVPADDVRGYIRRGLTFTWIYAARFRRTPPGLDDLAAGRWPRFAPLPARAAFLPQHARP